MQIQASRTKDRLIIFVRGEIDEHSAKRARQETDKLIDESSDAAFAVFDLSAVSFMYSTGIGFLIGRYKKLKRLGMNAYISSPNHDADKILLMSGIYQLIPKIGDEKKEA